MGVSDHHLPIFLDFDVLSKHSLPSEDASLTLPARKIANPIDSNAYRPSFFILPYKVDTLESIAKRVFVRSNAEVDPEPKPVPTSQIDIEPCSENH